MSYFGFLARFILIPLAALTFLLWRRGRREPIMPEALQGVPPLGALAGLVTVAVAYTTPWDNYLVASKVWWYDKKLVNGLVLGYVPIEEYTFFVLQTLLTGAWVLWLAKHVPHDERAPKNPLLFRLGMAAALGAIWLGAVWNLFRGPKRNTYMSLVLAWALLPIIFQVAFGGDILWQHRRLVALGIIPSTLYLALSDSLAIDSGTWTINPEKTVNINLGGKLPLEEAVFFLVTNTLVSVGLTLITAKDSQKRVPPALLRLLGIGKP